MRLAAYAGTSALVAAGALLKAFHQRPNFYSATVYLSQSNACVLILTNLALVCACTFIYALQRLLYGPLRPIEIEQLSEKAWYAVLDTLLAMPSLRDDVGGWLLAIFVLLLTGKVWGWIGEGRVDVLEQQPPQNPRLFHARLSSSLLLSMAFDAFMFSYCLRTVLDDPRPGMMVIFTFEFAILTIFSMFTTSRYILALVEARVLRLQTLAKVEEMKAEIRAERERLQRDARPGEPATLPSEEDIDENEIDVPGWEEKRRWLFGLELATDFVKIIVYTIFFTISLTFIGLPMHIMRDVYLTFASFTKRIQDYGNYRRATLDMNNRYPDATADELANDNTCIVCREAMVPWVSPNADAGQPGPTRPANEGLRAKKLPCGHILHLRCLKAWLERQQACPTCRRPVVTPANAANRAIQAPLVPPEGAAGGPQAAAGAGRQPAAANAANAANAPPQPQAQNRLRWLNLGPMRIGFYNGPANQIANALRDQQQQPPVANPAPTTSTMSTQVQLLQIEERLMREAHNMAVEQAQVATLRSFEAELARLRGQHGRPQPTPTMGGQAFTQQAVPRNAPIQPPANFFQPPFQAGQPIPAGMGFGMPMVPLQPMQYPVYPQAYQPPQGQQPLGSGHVDMPPGMTLPEGWTMMPLQRLGGQMQQNATNSGSWMDNEMPSAMDNSQAAPDPTAPAQDSAHVTPTQVLEDSTRAEQEPMPAGADLGQVDGAGRALSTAAETPTSTGATGSSGQGATNGQTTASAPVPWSDSSWAFDGDASQPSGADLPSTSSISEDQTEMATQDTNGRVSPPTEGLAEDASKGKARAVSVEEVPDAEE